MSLSVERRAGAISALGCFQVILSWETGSVLTIVSQHKSGKQEGADQDSSSTSSSFFEDY